LRISDFRSGRDHSPAAAVVAGWNRQSAQESACHRPRARTNTNNLAGNAPRQGPIDLKSRHWRYGGNYGTE
jgi:hypothetical protein